jgi:hypothetical protein
MKALKDQLKKIPGKQDLFFFVDSENLVENIRFIQEEKIENIALNPFHSYKINNIDWFREVPFIKKAELGGCYNINFDGLKYLSNLQYLSFNAMKDQKVDFSKISNLVHLSLQFNKNLKGLEELKLLETLAISKGEEFFFNDSNFRNYEKLKILSIVDSKLPRSLVFLKYLHSLKHLELNYIKSNIDLTELETLKGTLEIFKIGYMKKVESFKTISQLLNLKILSIVDTLPIENTDFINQMRDLEILIVIGSSYFIDGDLSKLRGRLKHVSIDNKRHYNLKYEDLKGDFHLE